MQVELNATDIGSVPIHIKNDVLPACIHERPARGGNGGSWDSDAIVLPLFRPHGGNAAEQQCQNGEAIAYVKMLFSVDVNPEAILGSLEPTLHPLEERVAGVAQTVGEHAGKVGQQFGQQVGGILKWVDFWLPGISGNDPMRVHQEAMLRTNTGADPQSVRRLQDPNGRYYNSVVCNQFVVSSDAGVESDVVGAYVPMQRSRQSRICTSPPIVQQRVSYHLPQQDSQHELSRVVEDIGYRLPHRRTQGDLPHDASDRRVKHAHFGAALLREACRGGYDSDIRSGEGFEENIHRERTDESIQRRIGRHHETAGGYEQPSYRLPRDRQGIYGVPKCRSSQAELAHHGSELFREAYAASGGMDTGCGRRMSLAAPPDRSRQCKWSDVQLS